MREELYRLFSLLLILIMLFTIQPAAWAEEDILFEEPVELPAPVPETEVMEEILPDPEETAADDEEQETEHELRIDNTEAFMAAEENAGGSVRFSGRGLLLSNRIGLAFYLDVPEAYREGSFVRFDGKGVAQSCEIPDAPDEHGLYRFVCWLSPLELARRVTPTFCRGELSVPGEPYAVRDFIEAAGEDDERCALLTALGNFGHFSELCFGSAEPEMPQYGEEDYDYDKIRTALSDQKMEWTGTGGITQAVPLIRVEPNLCLVLSPRVGAAETLPAVTVFGAVTEPDEDGLFTLAAVRLNGLGTRLDVDITDAGERTGLKLSALSVVRAALEPDGPCSPEQKDFCAALYTLYEAVKDWEAAG